MVVDSRNEKELEIKKKRVEHWERYGRVASRSYLIKSLGGGVHGI